MSIENPRSNGRATVDPALLFGISLALSLLLWWPSLTAALHGDLDITVAGLRYLAALGVSWVCVFALGTLFAGYARSAHERHQPQPPALPPGPAEHPLRRVEDAPIADAPGAAVEDAGAA
jgi:hypothetical protein